jgi:hypothetical protein
LKTPFQKQPLIEIIPGNLSHPRIQPFLLFPVFAPTVERCYAKAVPKPIDDSQVPINPPDRVR